MKHFIAIILMAVSGIAGAIDLELGLGQAFAQKAEDGIYYQERFRHDTRLQGGFQSIGLTDKTAIFGNAARWRVFGFYMGSFSNDADAVQDENYSPKSATGCIAAGCGDFSRYQTELSVRGVATTLSAEFNAFQVAGKNVILSPEIGIAVYQVKLDEYVYTLDGRAPSLTDRDYHYKWGLNAGEVFGIGAEWGNFRLSVRRYKINMANRGQVGVWQADIPSSIGELPTVYGIACRHDF